MELFLERYSKSRIHFLEMLKEYSKRKIFTSYMYFFFENEATIFAKIIRIRKVEQSFSLSQSGNLSSQQEYMLNSLHEYNSEMDDQDGSLNV